jgi:hypothetical protein
MALRRGDIGKADSEVAPLSPSLITTVRWEGSRAKVLLDAELAALSG